MTLLFFAHAVGTTVGQKLAINVGTPQTSLSNHWWIVIGTMKAICFADIKSVAGAIERYQSLGKYIFVNRQ
jgi:hypothetical protein